MEKQDLNVDSCNLYKDESFAATDVGTGMISYRTNDCTHCHNSACGRQDFERNTATTAADSDWIDGYRGNVDFIV